MLRRRTAAAPPPPAATTTPISASTATSLFSSDLKIWYFCLIFRLINALLIQTYFNPDEHWQSLEVAHRIAFGYGHLTWEWRAGIRSYLHPLIFAFLYKLITFLGLDTNPWIMVKAPRLLQAVFSSVGDVYLYKLSKMVFNENVARWALFSQLVNWFVFYCTTRTLSNSLEAVLTVVGLFYWISWKGASRKLGLVIAGLACSLRPTSAITWLYVGMLDLLGRKDRFRFLLFEVLPIGSLVLMFTCYLDWWMYGSWTIVPLNFLKFNFLSSGGDYYGTHKWHWYLSQGFPVMLSTFLPFSIFGMLKSKEWRLSCLIAWVLGIYSILGHKEFRFVLPVLPIALMFSGYCLANLSKAYSRDGERKSPKTYILRPSKIQLAVLFLVITNLPMALYMSLVHQRGSEDAMYYLSKEAQAGKVKSILFLMPCHSTPYYSTLHYNLPMRLLDCSPSDNKGVLDESDRFMTDPVGFVSEMLKNSSCLPSHIVLFDPEERHLAETLIAYSYREVKRFFHAHFPVDRELQASVVIYMLPRATDGCTLT